MNRLDRHDQILMARRKRYRTEVNRPRPWLWAGQSLAAIFAVVLVSVALVTALGVMTIVGIYRTYAAQMPPVGSIEAKQDEFQTVRIFDRTGKYLLYESVDPRPFRGDRRYMPLSQMSPWVSRTAIALEDRNFWDNPGINARGLLRAFASNMQGGQVQGGSSITQQLIKNIIIDVADRTQQSYARKIKEVILSLEVTRRYPKEKILEWYLNYNYYGYLAYGVEAASQLYFGKSSKDLTLAEAAMLAPIPQFPSQNPITDPEEAKKRQGYALQAMVVAGEITQQEAEEAFRQEMPLRKSAAERFDILTAPHFALYVLDQIKQEFNTNEDPFYIWRKGLTVYTTLDVDLQKFAEQAAREQVAKLITEDKGASNSAVVALKNDTGEILAMVGSLDYNNEKIDGQVNVATSERQPGSSFKPYVYLTALDQGIMNPATMILDVPAAFPQGDGSYYRPENYDRQYHGPVSLRNALARSYNIPAIKVMDAVGVSGALRMAHRMGINGLDRGLEFYGLNLVLGGGEVELLDHTFAYSVLANRGVMIGEPVLPSQQRSGYRNLNPVSVLQVRDSDGNMLKQYAQPASERVFSADVAYLMADIMSDDVARSPAFGANTVLTLPDRKVAAKTGTTNAFKDNWTMGFTPQLTLGVWVGNTDNKSMRNVTGLSGAAPIWNTVMQHYHQGLPALWYDQPSGVTQRVVCEPSGLLPSDACQSQRSEIFVAGSEPTLLDTIWQTFEIDRETGQLASAATPPERRAPRSFQILPNEAADWAKENLPQPPTSASTTDGVIRQEIDPDVAIISPLLSGYIGSVVEIKGNARGGPYRVEFGPGFEPQQWTQIGPEHGNEVISGTLEVFDTNPQPEGIYALRLTVNRGDGPRQVTIPVTIDHTPPTVVVTEPKPDKLYVDGDDEQINISALVNDTWSVGRVEFVLDGRTFFTSTVATNNVYSARWDIEMRSLEQIESAGTENWLPFATDDREIQPGRMLPFADGFQAIRTSGGIYLESHLLKVRAFDSAGNFAESDEVRVYVRQKKE